MTRGFYKLAGFFFFGLAVVGFVLPVLPGTPFLLGAAWCFARSSEKWHQRLLNSQLFGPIIRNWEVNRCISLRTKIVAIGSMLVVGGASIVFGVDNIWLRGLTFLLIGIGTVVVLSTRTCNGSGADVQED